jgi:CubicO group peptidase (beta-lactamase class C family)
MRKLQGCLLVLAGAIPLLIAVVAIRIWVTMPPTVEPGALPIQTQIDPSTNYALAVEEGRQLARSLTSEEKLPGLSLAVSIGGELVWTEGVGWSNLDERSAMTPELMFRVGGITQTITAAAVGLLHDRGELDLDAPIQQYVKAFPEKESPVSTRQLMTHSAGLAPHRGEGGLFQGRHCANDAERVSFFAEAPLRSEPGSEVSYSNYNWVLVGAAIAEITGERYVDFVSREIFTPLGMESTVLDHTERYEEGSAYFHYPRLMLNPRYGFQDAPKIDLSCYEASVGFLSTPSDLARFGAAMMHGSLVQEATLEELRRPHAPSSDESSAQAAGWSVLSMPWGVDGLSVQLYGQGVGQQVRHGLLSATTFGGNVAGSTVSLLIVPEWDLAIAVAANTSGAENVPILAGRLAEIFIRRAQGR